MNHLILKGQKRGRILPFCSGTEKQKTTEILDFTGFSVVFLYMHIAKNAADRNRTGTGITTHGILSPGRLPVPPLRHNKINRMGDGGFEPPKALPADLQSVPFGHSGNHPYSIIKMQADDRTRTDNLLITNQLLCQLSHIGISVYTFTK